MASAGTSTAQALCPQCGLKGRKVGAETVAALAVETAQPGEAQARFCRTPECPTAYYWAKEAIPVAAIRVEVFQKSGSQQRPICYCFGHTVADVEDDARDNANPSLADQIAEACRQGLDECATANPQGSCCLANVRAVMRDVAGGSQPAGDDTSTGQACCAGGDCQ